MMTWMGGALETIRLIKMNILPRLLYLFLSLPVEIPLKQFREWNKHMSRFIWNQQRPRVKFSTLQLPEERSGISHLQLRPLVYWCNSSYVAKWKTLELSLTDAPMQSLLGCAEKKILQTQSQWVNCSLKVWGEVVKKFELQEQIKLLRWPAHDPEFTPALLDHRYKQWTYYGITAVCKIV